MDSVKILVVEDESIVAMDIRETLRAHGYEVLACVPSGEEALERVEAARPDLVLMDIRLQGEMDGLETARILRESYQVPSLFLTSHADREMLQGAKAADAVGYLLKPFDERELGVSLEMALHRIEVEKSLREKALDTVSGAGKGSPAVQGPPEHPILQIRTLGCIDIALEGKLIAGAETLSRAQRELLAMIVAAPQCKVSREEVQTALWPDSPPVKARSSFDSLLLRLRKTIEETGEVSSAAPYIVLQKGILSLVHCRVDAAEFADSVKKGLKHLGLAEYPAAEQALAYALGLWNGPFLLGAYGSEVAFRYAVELERMYADAAVALSEILPASARLDEALQVVGRALELDRTSETLVRTLCHLLKKGKLLTRVKLVLTQYEEALRQEGYPAAEVAEIMEGLSAPLD